jgi:glycerol-3-phosphate dehydrogenase (NAD(P)+)
VRLAVLGAGAWGTALAVRAALGTAASGDVALWARDPDQRRTLAATRRNDRYLPDIELPPGLDLPDDVDALIDAALQQQGLLLVATPMAGLEPMLVRIAERHRRAGTAADARCALAWLCKGFQAHTGRLGHEIAAEVLPGWPVTVLSGPTFAVEVARGQPTAMVAASDDADHAERWVGAFHEGSLRVYSSNDPIGVEVGGAVKNVLAIATGIADGMPPRGLGTNARAALITRGLAEMARLGVRMGARAETFMGLAGLGDLVLTATGDLSRNRQVGMALAEGRSLPEVLGSLGHVAEGVRSAAMVLRRAEALGIDMPITAAVVDVIDGRCTPAQALQRLMAREARPETS